MFELAEKLKAYGLDLEYARDWFMDNDLDFKYVVLFGSTEVGRYNSLKEVRSLLKAEAAEQEQLQLLIEDEAEAA